MPSEVPYAADAEVSLTYDDLEVRQSRRISLADAKRTLQILRLQYEKEVQAGFLTMQTKFNYGWGLIKSPMREHQVEGVRLLTGSCYSRG